MAKLLKDIATKKQIETMRKAKPQKRVILPDPVFGEVMVAKFVNHLMLDGKKNTAYSVFYGALDVVGNKMKDAEKSALEIWKQALDNITPLVEVKSKRIGGATFRFRRRFVLTVRRVSQ